MFKNFKQINIKAVIKDFTNKNTDHWLKLQEKNTLNLFKKASKHCKAYKDFLKINKVKVEKIKTIEDFKNLPPTNKENYIRKYPLEWLIWKDSFTVPRTMHATSGSTGEPTYFTRDIYNDLKRGFIFELFLNHNKESIANPTLFIITFGMGIWSAGVGIFSASYLINNIKKYPLTIISPGVNMPEILKILKNLSPSYKQIIIAGYPPFAKDIIDNAVLGIPALKKNKFRFIFTGEGFPEEFRHYLCSKVDVDNIYTDTMNTYGTSEFGATSIETPLSILIRNLVYKNKKILFDLFGEYDKIPTLVQNLYTDLYIYSKDNELFLTGNYIMPLINYQIGDTGGTTTYEKINEILSDYRINIQKEAKENHINNYIYKLPFIYVFTRKNLTVTLYGVLIYPEFIQPALMKRTISKFVTGKFIMSTKYDKSNNQYLEILLELKKGINELNKKQIEEIKKIIVDTLRNKSSEYRELEKDLKEKAHPLIKTLPYEAKGLFEIKSKHKWVR